MTKIKVKKVKPNDKAIKSRVEIAKDNIKRNKNSRKINLSKNNKQKALKKKLVKVAYIFFSVLILIMLGGGAFGLNYLNSLNAKLPNPETIFPDIPVASEIYDRFGASGTRLYRIIGAQNSDDFDIRDVPDHVKLAFIAAEDKEFFQHNGFNPAAIIRCGLRFVGAQESLCGGSTITQQLVKLTTKNAAPSIERKIEELLLAMKVEQTYTKIEILGMYLRIAPFGSSIVGLKTASNFYFGKEPKELNLAEAAILASIIQDPNRLSPTVPIDQNIERARNDVRTRQEYVIDQLRQNIQRFNNDLKQLYSDPEMDPVIEDFLLDEALAFEWQTGLKRPIATDIRAGHFVNFVMQQLQTKNYKNGVEPFTREELQTEGYRIITSLDYQVQQIAEAYALRGGTSYPQWNVGNAAVMTALPETGEIIAWAGSKSFFGEDEGCDARGSNCTYNPQVDVLQSLQEPGSSNKPLGYYMAYKDGLIFPGSILPDIPIRIRDANGNMYEPKNWNNTFQGVFYSAKSALVESRNIPAIQIIRMVGVQNYINTFKEFGYTTATGEYGEAAILGGISVLPWEHVQAHTAFANGGDMTFLNPILEIYDKNNNLIYQATPNKKRVGDPQAIFLLNETIKNYDGYSDRGREMAGKTGTTENSMDAWYIGYSPDFVTACWAGNNNNAPMDLSRGFPFYVVHPWCKDYFSEIGDSPYLTARKPFQRPGGIVTGGGTCNSDGECMGIEAGFMIDGRRPKIDHKKVKVMVCDDQPNKKARTIDILLGRAIEREFTYFIMPVTDLQSQLDEFIAKRHAERPAEFELNGGPTQECDIERSTSGVPGPFFSISNPVSGASSSSNITIQGGAFVTDSSITQVYFEINGVAIPGCVASSNFNAFDLTCNIGAVLNENGTYGLVGVATDALGRVNRSQVINIVYNSATSSQFVFNTLPSASLTYGVNVGSSCTTPPCSYNIVAQYNGSNTLSNVELFQSKNGVVTKVGNMSIAGNLLTFSGWGTDLQAPISSTDQYFFYVQAGAGLNGRLRSNSSTTTTVSN